MVRIININTCKTSRSFQDEEWLKIYELFHGDLKVLPKPQNTQPIPVLLEKYWKELWKEETDSYKDFLSPSNLHLKEMGRIWEYIQIIYSIYLVSEKELKKKKVLSLGAGVEPCLFVFDKLGCQVTASDLYNSQYYWFRNQIKYLRTQPEVFSHFKDFKPNIKFINLNLKNKKEIRNLEKFDIIYSVSSLEHIYSFFYRKKKLFRSIIKHLNDNGIFSFTTELTVIFNKVLNLRILLILMMNYLINKKNSKNPIKDFFRRPTFKNYKRDIKQLLLDIINLFRYNRRYDFFTSGEILKIISILYKNKVYLVDKINWKFCKNFLIKSKQFKNHYHNSISLTFSKDPKYKQDLKNLIKTKRIK